MSIMVHLTPSIEQILLARASDSGRPLDTVIAEVIERGIRADRTLDEILAPLRAQVKASGISEQELEEMFENARNEVYLEKQGMTS